MLFSLPLERRNSFKKTAIATLCNALFVEMASVAVAGDVTPPPSLAVDFSSFSIPDQSKSEEDFKNTLAVTFPEKSITSIKSLTLASNKTVPAPSNTDIPITDPATTSSLVVNETYDYVKGVTGSNRWLIVFRDPILKALNGKNYWKDWDEYGEELRYSDRTILTVTANDTNDDPNRNFEKRFSIFGAFFDGEQNAKENLKGVKGDSTKVVLDRKDDLNKINALNEIFSNRTVRLNLENRDGKYDFYVSDIYGANNDFAGTVKGAGNSEENAYFLSYYNAVNLSLEDNILYFERIKGAKGASWRDLDASNGTKPLTDASRNVVYIHGSNNVYGTEDGLLDFSTPIGNLEPNLIASGRIYNTKVGLTFDDIDFYLKPSIMGGDALKAQRNVVYLENVTTKGIDRKFGIVGGRAQDGTYVKNSTSIGADSIGNIVVLRNSNIGLVPADIENNGGGTKADGTNNENNIDGTNIYGGLGYSRAMGNVVVVSHSKVLGNVQGGITFRMNFMGDKKDDRKKFTEDEILATFNKELEENYVFLDDAYLVGKSAAYASSAAMVPTEEIDKGNGEVPFTKSEVINFRRGTIFINGSNLASSVFASNVVFGEKYKTEFSELRDEYVTSTSSTLTLDQEGSLPISFGRSLAESYVRNAAGFHSTLSRQTENQSNLTNERHNFWTSVTVNLGKRKIEENPKDYIELTRGFDGTGTAIADAVIMSAAGDKVTVEDSVVYSLLKQDDTNGTKTYLGISSGYHQNNDGKIDDGQVRALNINWSRIIDYRISVASGGIYTYEKIENNTESAKNGESYTNTLLPFPELILKTWEGDSQKENTQKLEHRYVWVDGDTWYASEDDFKNKKDGITDSEEKVALLKGVYSDQKVHKVLAPIEQGLGKEKEVVAKGVYELASYLFFNDMKIVYGKGDLDKDDKIDDKNLYVQGRLKNGYIYSVTPILKTSVKDFVNLSGNVENYDVKGRSFKVYESLKNPGKITYLYDVEEGKYYESVAKEGDIVSITNPDLDHESNSSEKGEFGGIALVSKLIEVDVNGGKLLQLYGLNNSSPINKDGAPCHEEEENGKTILVPYSKESYTAQMKITGEGGISIPGKDTEAPEGYTVLIDRSLQDTTGKTPEDIKELEKNTYKGQTIIGDGSTLNLLSNYALGETSSAVLGAEATINLDGTDKTQFVASFDANPNSDVKFIKNGTLEIGNGGNAGTLGRISGEGTVIINASSLEWAGDYSKGQPTVSGNIQLEDGSNVFTDPTKLGWKQIGTSDIKLGNGSVLTINYKSEEENFKDGYSGREISGSGTLAIVNTNGTSPTKENFIFSDKQEKDIFNGTIALTKVNINLTDSKNYPYLVPVTLEINKGSTATTGTSVPQGGLNIGGFTLNEGGTLDYSEIQNHFGEDAVSNVLNSGKEFKFSSGGIVKVNLKGDVPEFNAGELKGLPLLDQDDAGPFIYLGYGDVSSDSSLTGVSIQDENGVSLGKVIDQVSYNKGVATLSYGIGLTDGSAMQNPEKGFGIGYVLQKVHVNQGKVLALRNGNASNRLSAFLTSDETNAGKVEIYDDILITNGNNHLASEIEVTKGAHLAANGGALGNGLYSQQVTLQEGSTLTMQNGQQTIGRLEQDKESSIVELTKGSNLILTQKSISKGTVTGEGSLTVQSGELEISGSNNGFTGTLNIQNNALATTNKLKSLGLSTINVNKGGTLELKLAEDATWSQVTTRAVGVRTVNGEGTVLKDEKGILTIDENYKLAGTTIVRNGGVYVGQKDAPLNAPGSFVVEEPSILRGFGSVAGLTNAGTVYMNDKNLEEASPNTFVVKGDYVGQGGLLVFNAKLASDNDSLQDQLHITGNASGSSIVRVRNLKGEGAETEDGITLIQIDKNSTARFALESPLSVGAFNYQLFSTPDKRRWYLSTKNNIYRSEVGTYISAALASEQMNMRLHDRMGHSFVVDPASGEVYKAAGWVRQLGSHSHFRSGGNTTHMNTSLTQLGADLYRKKTSDDNNFIFGFFGGGIYSKSHTRSLDVSKGKTDGFALGVYGTYYTGVTADDSFYVDTWLQYGRYDNKLYGNNNDFKYRSHGFSFSVETGLTIPLADFDEEGKTQFKMQPQAQIIVNGVKANNATDKSGTEYKQLGRNNVTLRLGSRFMIQKENGLTAFAEGNWIHNTKKAGVQMDSDSVYMEAGRNLGEFRVGFEGRLSKNLNGWLTGSIRGGKGGYHTESAQIGLKYQF